jgi:hypothetical protein
MYSTNLVAQQHVTAVSLTSEKLFDEKVENLVSGSLSHDGEYIYFFMTR